MRKEGDVIDIKIDTACSLVMNPTSSNPVNPLDANGDAEKFNYDVFISYSHRQPKQAEKLLNDMTVANSDLKIFFDRSELTMGKILIFEFQLLVNAWNVLLIKILQSTVDSLLNLLDTNFCGFPGYRSPPN